MARLRLVKPSDITLPALPGARRRSTPARRLLLGLIATALTWGSIWALVCGAVWLALAGMLLARLCEWSIAETARW